MRALLAVALVACSNGAPVETMTCGAGTKLVDTECVAPPRECGVGTMEDRGTCVMRPATAVLRAPARIWADPTRPVDVVVTAPERVAVRVVPPSAGTLGPIVGGVAAFTPCRASTPGCLGPATIEVARAYGPDGVITATAVELVATPPLDASELCRGMQIYDRTGLVVEGSGYLAADTVSLHDAVVEAVGTPRRFAARFTPPTGASWRVEVDTTRVQRDLVPGVFERASSYEFDTAPFLEVQSLGAFARCDRWPTGEFEIIAYDPSHEPPRVTLAFRITCHDEPATEARGCLNIE